MFAAFVVVPELAELFLVLFVRLLAALIGLPVAPLELPAGLAGLPVALAESPVGLVELFAAVDLFAVRPAQLLLKSLPLLQDC